jgi:hypothetical protein
MGRAAERSVELLERLPPGPELVEAYGRMAVVPIFQGRSPEESIVWAEKAIELGESLGLRYELLGARMWRGFGRCELGDLDGITDLEIALAESRKEGGTRVGIAYINLADQIWRIRGPEAALELHSEAIEYVRRRGGSTIWIDAEGCWMRFDLGMWNELEEMAEEIAQLSQAQGRGQPVAIASTYRALVLVRRGAIAGASAVMDDTLPHAREIEDPQVLGPALVARALIDEARGDLGSARAGIEEWDAVTRNRPFFRAQNLADAVRISCAAGDVALAERILDGVVTAAERDRLSDLSARAAIAEARSDAVAALPAYVEVADGWSELGCVLEHGLALLGGARCQLALERADEAATVLAQAGTLFSALGALPLIDETEALLGAQRRTTAG